MRNTNIKIAAALFSFFILFTGQLWAEESSFEIDSLVTIAPDSGAAHFLLKPNVNFPDTTMQIDRALLDLWVSPQTEDTTFIAIRVYPIISSWSAEAVSWTSPWTTPGGDINETKFAQYIVTLPGEQNIQVDLTDLCMRWADGRIPYYGFLLTISESSLAEVEFLHENGTGPMARLSISYTTSSSE